MLSIQLAMPFQVRIRAYNEIESQLSEKQYTVLKAIFEQGRATMQQTADYLGLPINQVSGRFTELHDVKYGLFYIQPCGVIRVNNRPRTIFQVTDAGKQLLKEVYE